MKSNEDIPALYPKSNLLVAACYMPVLQVDFTNATSLIFAELYKEGSDWNFRAEGELLQGTLTTLANKYR